MIIVSKTNENDDLGKKMKALRSLWDFSQSEMADRGGMSHRYYQKIESGSTNPSFDKITSIFRSLKISPSILDSNYKDLVRSIESARIDASKAFNTSTNMMSLNELKAEALSNNSLVHSPGIKAKILELDNLKLANESLRTQLSQIPEDIRDALKTADDASLRSIRASLGLTGSVYAAELKEKSSDQ